MIQSLLNSFRGILLGPVIAKRVIAQKQPELNWEITSDKIIIDLIKNETISPENCQTIISKDEEMTSGELILKILPSQNGMELGCVKKNILDHQMLIV